MKSQFYNIAGQHIKITGEKAYNATKLDSFNKFACEDNGSIPYTIEINDKYDDFCEDNQIYKIKTADNVIYAFFKLDDNRFGVKLHELNIDAKISIIYDASADYAVIGGNTDNYSIHYSTWIAYEMLTLKNEVVAIHTSCVVVDDKVVLFLGESGTGKSTHSRGWVNNIPGATLLNDDSPIISIEDGEVYAYGSPWSGKTPCYKNEKYPVKAIIRLSQAPYNNITRLNIVNGFRALFPSCPPPLSNTEPYATYTHGIISAILTKIPVWHLECLPDANAVKLCYETIY